MNKDEIKQMVNTISEYEKRLSDKYIEIDNLNRDYRNAFERLKSQQQEIDRLKSENTQLKTEVREFEVELNARLTCDFVRTAQKHAVQDFADKVKEEVYPFLQAEMYNKKHFITGDLISDKLLENQNIGILKAQDVLSKWFKVKIDELLKEYE